MAKRKTVTRYRDKQTGRFVSRKTWKLSRAHGGNKFKRVKLAKPRRAKPLKPLRPRKLPKPKRERLTEEEIEEAIEDEEAEYAGAFDSPGSGRKK